jgi:hypothetical protein
MGATIQPGPIEPQHPARMSRSTDWKVFSVSFAAVGLRAAALLLPHLLVNKRVSSDAGKKEKETVARRGLRSHIPIFVRLEQEARVEDNVGSKQALSS